MYTLTGGWLNSSACCSGTSFEFISRGNFLGLPFTITLTLLVLAILSLLNDRTALGLFVERGFYGTAVPAPKAPCFSPAAREAQIRLRSEWFKDGLNKLSEAELVFLDPDNGIAATRAKKYRRSSVKYLFEDEVTEWGNRGQSVVLYQHQQRRSLNAQVSDQRKIL